MSSRTGAACVAAAALLLVSCGAAEWSNYLGENSVGGTRHEPGSALEVLAIVREASLNDARVRAVGSGHSSSTVAQPRRGAAWVDVRRLNEIDMPWPYYRVSNASRRFVRVGAGATIRRINDGLAALEPRRALFNMGNYDAQTIAGAFSTGTHGSGLSHGPITDRIVAIELVTDELLPGSETPVQRLLRIEPSDGVTDAARFAAEHADYGGDGDPIRVMALEQDDAVFDAALINLGTFGIITSVTVETRPAFWLREQDEMKRWYEEAPPDLEGMAYENPEFLQITLVPHRILDDGGSHVGEIVYMSTTRTEERDCDQRPPRRPASREDLGRVLARISGTELLEQMQLRNPWFALRSVVTTFEQRDTTDSDPTEHYVSRSDYVLINSLAPEFTATSIDIQVPLDRAALAISRVLEIARERETFVPGPVWQRWWHTSPLGIRFVGQSRALLAPSFDGPVASIEIPLLYSTRTGGRERALRNLYRNRMLETLERELTRPEYGGRPHWGQRHWMSAPRAREMYGDNWDCWVEQYRRFNGHGTFDNRFTDQMCLSNADTPPCADIEVAGVCGVDDPPGAPTEDGGEPEPVDAIDTPDLEEAGAGSDELDGEDDAVELEEASE